jgi:hypothetical protein
VSTITTMMVTGTRYARDRPRLRAGAAGVTRPRADDPLVERGERVPVEARRRDAEEPLLVVLERPLAVAPFRDEVFRAICYLVPVRRPANLCRRVCPHQRE